MRNIHVEEFLEWIVDEFHVSCVHLTGHLAPILLNEDIIRMHFHGRHVILADAVDDVLVGEQCIATVSLGRQDTERNETTTKVTSSHW